jgi:DNA-directed RNA polymerase specialized sigma24 family protein
MARSDHTNYGGKARAFPQTQWTVIHQARAQGGQAMDRLRAEVYRSYAGPVFAFLCRKGYDVERAKDLCQGFFTDVVLGRDLILEADRQRGAFRSLMMAAAERYATDAVRREAARKRRPRGGLASLEALEPVVAHLPGYLATPAQAFLYGEACQLLDEILRIVERRCRTAGLTAHWEIFRRRVLDPIRTRTPPPPLGDICQELGIAHSVRDGRVVQSREKIASLMIPTVTRRFRATVKARVRLRLAMDDDLPGQSTDERLDEAVDDFLRTLMSAVSAPQTPAAAPGGEPQT